MNDQSKRTLVPGKETVVKRPGADWSFHIPERHEIELVGDGGYVALSTPHVNTIWRLARIDESDPDEVVVYLGEEQGRGGPPSFGGQVLEARGYALPEIQDEFDLLKARWKNAGLPEQEFNAWPQGASHEDQLRRIRRQLREAEGRTSAS